MEFKGKKEYRGVVGGPAETHHLKHGVSYEIIKGTNQEVWTIKYNSFDKWGHHSKYCPTTKDSAVTNSSLMLYISHNAEEYIILTQIIIILILMPIYHPFLTSIN